MLDLCKLEEICKKYSGKLLRLVLSSSVYLGDLGDAFFSFFSYMKSLIRIPLLSHIQFQIWELGTLRNSLQKYKSTKQSTKVSDITLLTKQIYCTIS